MMGLIYFGSLIILGLVATALFGIAVVTAVVAHKTKHYWPLAALFTAAGLFASQLPKPSASGDYAPLANLMHLAFTQTNVYLVVAALASCILGAATNDWGKRASAISWGLFSGFIAYILA